MNVVEGMTVSHQLAQDERSSARREHFRRFRDRAKLPVAVFHVGHSTTSATSRPVRKTDLLEKEGTMILPAAGPSSPGDTAEARKMEDQ